MPPSKSANAAATAYQFVIFGCQRPGNYPPSSHTWAVVHETTVASKSKRAATPLVISWLPKSLKIKFFGPPEKGYNFSHDETMDWIRSGKSRVKHWGPFGATKELFDRFGARIERLNLGRLRYVMLDGKYRPDVATNCIHGVSDIGLPGDLLDTGKLRGYDASKKVLKYFRAKGMVTGTASPNDEIAAIIAEFEAHNKSLPADDL